LYEQQWKDVAHAFPDRRGRAAHVRPGFAGGCQRERRFRHHWSLTTLTYNLKRVLNLVSFQKLMAAVI